MSVHVDMYHYDSVSLLQAESSDNCPITLTKSAVKTMNEFFEACSKVFSFQWLIKWLGMVVLLLVSTSAHCT